MKQPRLLIAVAATAVLLLAALAIAPQLPPAGANALLHPLRQHVLAAPPASCDNATFTGADAADVTLRGWRCRGSQPRRGTLIYLHGIADNRASAAGLISRFGRRGLDVVAYDSRGHGESDGNLCTYGFFEKDDLRRVIDTVAPGPVVLLGTSLGAAVAIQEAAADPRVTGVVAAEIFSDLRTVATERAPFFFTHGVIDRAFQLAEEQAHFRVDAVSPVAAAASISIPVLLIHGDADTDTPPEHAQRVLAALAGRKRLILVAGARHNQSLTGDVWTEIERWVEEVIAHNIW